MRLQRTRVIPRKPKKGRFRLFATSALVLTTGMVAAPNPARAQNVPVVTAPGALRFDIPSGPLDAALRAFEAASGVSVQVKLPADTIGMMHSPGVSGVFDLTTALERLLDGTSLSLDAFHYDGDHLVMHSADLGDLKLSANAVSELVIRPLAAKPPQPMAEKKLAQKTDPPANAKKAEPAP